MPYKTTPIAGSKKVILSNAKTGHVYGKTSHPLAMMQAIEISKHKRETKASPVTPSLKAFSLPKKDLIAEHKHLIKVLETGTVAQRAKEAAKQKKELAKYLK
jgi:hypothetical protein